MRAAIYDPYLDTLGGGERYVMTVAHILHKNGWDVDVEWTEDGILQKLENRLGLNLSGIKIIPTIKRGKGYDLCFWLSDGSIPTLWAKRNILHFQVPFHDVGGKSLFNQLKLKKVNKIICNSKFTKKFIDEEYNINSDVLYPPVDVDSFKPSKKQNIIINIGRFSQLLQAKRQDVLIDAFKDLVDTGLKAWKLILAGGTDVGGKEVIEELRVSAKAYPIQIIDSPDFQTIKKLYSRAKIFWSASGFEVDEEAEPEKVEHFGISVVEAMAAGCVPIVVRSGGHKEIVEDGEDGILWNSKTALSNLTLEIIKDDKKRLWVAENAWKKAEAFSQEKFEQRIYGLLV